MGTPAHDPRSEAQAAHERAMTEVSDVLVNVEHALARAKKAKKRLGPSPEESNALLALGDAIKSLEQVRTRLQKDAYFAGNEMRLV
ncbi:hypothetical protein [Mycobacterium sp. 852002-10029_SCH5224772]|uniref:hypothetical protein n=1 Tax=Mycobacterium sp. 852002-10029_SCH5224772 TaxID=1834083 RepID=UPI0007FB80FA|nr:hypothetical protein [Mycobacterium sp. 852002-10029_SCH5224772]OBE99006.1 hypothetical protein A5775_07670 [Mycobacterium sp. 852002-10029_SCH5224772]